MFDWLDDSDQEGWQKPGLPTEVDNFTVQMGFPPIDEIVQVYTGLVKSMALIPNGTNDYELSRRLGQHLIERELRFVKVAESAINLANIANAMAVTVNPAEKARLTDRLRSELQQVRHAMRPDRSPQDESTWLVRQAMVASVALNFLNELEISITLEDIKS